MDSLHILIDIISFNFIAQGVCNSKGVITKIGISLYFSINLRINFTSFFKAQQSD